MQDRKHTVGEGTKIRIMHTNLLPGDTKLSTKWKSESIVKAKHSAETKAPINQLLTYCANANVRYGYLITQEELVVFRVSERRNLTKLPQRISGHGPPQDPNLGKGDHKWHVEYKAIPWEFDSQPPTEDLTVNLALWWLHMLATKERSINVKYSKLGTGNLTPLEPEGSQLSSFDFKEGEQDDDSDAYPSVSPFSSFGSKRRRDEDDSNDMLLGKVGKRKSRKGRDRKPQDFSMSFDSQMST